MCTWLLTSAHNVDALKLISISWSTVPDMTQAFPLICEKKEPWNNCTYLPPYSRTFSKMSIFDLLVLEVTTVILLIFKICKKWMQIHHILNNYLPLIPVRYTVLYSEAILGLAHLSWKCNLAVVRPLSVCLFTF